MARIHRLVRLPDGTTRVILQGVERMRIERFTQTEPYLSAELTLLPDHVANDAVEQALGRSAQDLFASLVVMSPQLPDELESAVRNVRDGRQLAYLISSSAGFKLDKAQAILETDPLGEKLKLLTRC